MTNTTEVIRAAIAEDVRTYAEELTGIIDDLDPDTEPVLTDAEIAQFRYTIAHVAELYVWLTGEGIDTVGASHQPTPTAHTVRGSAPDTPTTWNGWEGQD